MFRVTQGGSLYDDSVYSGFVGVPVPGSAGRFDGGKITSDAGALLPRETERITETVRKFAACFTDHRDADLIEHRVTELVAQRIYRVVSGV